MLLHKTSNGQISDDKANDDGSEFGDIESVTLVCFKKNGGGNMEEYANDDGLHGSLKRFGANDTSFKEIRDQAS